jgi:hypothetical protein
MNTVELGLLALILSALVYFLTYDNICPHEKGPFLGLPLKTPNSKLHVLVTGGAGYIGSHAAQRMLKDGHSVTVVDNLSRGNLGAVNVLKSLADPGRFQFVNLDLGNGHALKQMFRQCHFDLVMHFAAVAYVGVFHLFSPVPSFQAVASQRHASHISSLLAAPQADLSIMHGTMLEGEAEESRKGS